MSKEEIVRYVAEWFGIEPNEDGTFDLDDYDWTSGCYMNGNWFCLAEVVGCIEGMVRDYGLKA